MAGTFLKALGFKQPSAAISWQWASNQYGRLTLLGLHKGTLQYNIILVKCTR